MSLIMHPLHNTRIVIDITPILPIDKKSTAGSVPAENVEELSSVLVWSIVESKCNRSGGCTSIDDGTNWDGSVSRDARRSLRYGSRRCSSDRCCEEGVCYHAMEGHHLAECIIKNG